MRYSSFLYKKKNLLEDATVSGRHKLATYQYKINLNIILTYFVR